jgi:phosphatidylserine decarboxylase
MPELGVSPTTSDSNENSAAPLRGLRRALFVLLTLLPKNAMSRAMGRVTAMRLPGPIQRAEIRLFAALAGVAIEEARDDVADFASLQQFFTRALRPGARPLEGDDKTLVSPCDGAWGESGAIESGTMMQVKGRAYRVADLLCDEDLAAAYEGGRYATFYLSPRDYHRFHTPTAGRITRVEYIPGALWPVNSIGLLGVDGLFAQNERLCAYLELGPGAFEPGPGALELGPGAFEPGPGALELSPGEGAGVQSGDSGPGSSPGIAMIAVGATMVGSVRLTFDEMRTNVANARPERRDFAANAPTFARGEEWGTFEFGSTIVMLTPPGEIELDSRATGTALRLGEAIGSVRR